MNAGNCDHLCKNWEGAYLTSNVMSNQGDEETESKSFASEDEGNQNHSDVGPFMRHLFEKQLYTDVTFFSSGNKASISAHRAVLAAKCDFFQKLLFGDQRNQADGMVMQVQINNVPFSVFTNIVKYFYTDDIEFTDDCTTLEVYAAAESFQIQPLIDQCKFYVESIELNEDNVCSIFEVCNAKHIPELKSTCVSYIQKNTSEVISSAKFEKCSFSTIHEICELQCLNLRSEMELLEAVLRWVNVQPEKTKKELLRSILKCIRFLSLTPKEFSDIIQRQADLLKPEEGLKILMHLNNPTSESLKTLPKWCNKCQRSYQVDHKEILSDVSQQYSEGRRIAVSLKPTSELKYLTDLTSTVELKCVKGLQQIKSIKFSFEDVKNDGSLLVDLVLRIHVSPNGVTFHKNHSIRSRESTYTFPKGVRVLSGQVLEIEVRARIRRSCKFLQFHWYDDPWHDFNCFFISKPKLGKLNFISEVEYVPVAR